MPALALTAPSAVALTQARTHLIPSLDMPSDHAPVIVDLELPLASRARAPRWLVLAGAVVVVAVAVQIARRSS